MFFKKLVLEIYVVGSHNEFIKDYMINLIVQKHRT